MGVQSEVLFGRDRELGVLAGVVAAAARGDGGVVVVEGVAGVGKSALLGAALRAASAGGVRCLVARAAELEHDFAFGVARQLLERARCLRPSRSCGRGCLLVRRGARAVLEVGGAPLGSRSSRRR